MHATSRSVRSSDPHSTTMKPQSHVVVLPSPGMGHVTPMLELAKRLVLHHSCHVTFLVITTAISPTQTRLLHSNHLPPGLTVVNLPPADVSVTDDTPVFSHLCTTVRETLLHLRQTLLEMQKPQALITDLFCTQAFDICSDLSIPVYILSTISSLFLAFSIFIQNPNRDVDVSGECIKVPGCAPIRTRDLPSTNNEDNEWYSYHLRRVPMAAGILMNTYPNLEPVSVRAIRENPFYRKIPPVYPIGPVVKETEPVTEKGVASACLAWLDKQASGSVLFVALGSGASLCAEQLTELAWGLELSQQRFLWAVRAPSDGTGLDSYLKAVAECHGPNDPESYLPEGFLERIKEVGMVVSSWVPQVLVLRHVSTGAFLSHCGWNSVLESVSCGVPVITWPLHADQMVNATAVAEEIGVGIRPVAEPGRRVVERKEVERVVRAAMGGAEGKALRDRARELRESALKAVKCGGISYEALAQVVKQWRS